MLRREGKDFRRMFVNKLMGRDEEGKIDWNRTWKLAKMALKTVLNTANYILTKTGSATTATLPCPPGGHRAYN